MMSTLTNVVFIKENPLRWSEKPGGFEQHLHRRCNNPLFAKNRRIVSQSDIDVAKARDVLDAKLLEGQFIELGERMLQINNVVTWGELNKMREEIEALIEEAAGVAGSAIPIMDKLQELRETLIFTARQACSANAEQLQVLNVAESYYESKAKKFLVSIIPQLLRKNGPIQDNEIIPALLMEEPDTIKIIMSTLWQDKESREPICLEASTLLETAITEGATLDTVAILSALGIAQK